ncbi:MAG: YvcK family protein, partial [Bacillota bacterium]|nr:YvcK family protein [Bacillota bacterium]
MFALEVTLLLGFLGLGLLILSLRQGTLSLIRNLNQIPRTEIDQSGSDRFAQMVYDRQVLSKGRRIVVIGGGTGLSVLLRGMKQVTNNI